MVNQVFSGNLTGRAFLLLNKDGARRLVEIITRTPPETEEMGPSVREALVEVGNILLGACLGIFHDLLQVHASFSLPRLYLENIRGMIESMIVKGEQMRYVLDVLASFHVRETMIGGYFVLRLGVSSLERLLETGEGWSEKG